MADLPHDHHDHHVEPVSIGLSVNGELPVVQRGAISDQRHFERFGCDVRRDNPRTPDLVEADVVFHREVHTSGRVTMEDGRRINFWGFEDPTSHIRNPFPSPIIRVSQGQVVHTVLEPSSGSHTIHHHGIEPTPHNDGVGHTSFEVKDLYTYQWQANASGTFIYHCHKNTTLHFELGMYGPLVVDPPEGEGFVRRALDVVPYDHERIWAVDDVDPAWHDPDIDHSTGMLCPWDGGEHLLEFTPEYFIVNGIAAHRTPSHPSVAVRCRVGERVLLRLIAAAYGVVDVRLPFDAQVVSVDGHTLGGPGVDRYSRPYWIPAGGSIEMVAAQRFDLLVEPGRTGVFDVPILVKHWITGRAHGRLATTITVT